MIGGFLAAAQLMYSAAQNYGNSNAPSVVSSLSDSTSDEGLSSSLQGSNVPSNAPAQANVSGSQASKLIRQYGEQALQQIGSNVIGGVGSAISGAITNKLVKGKSAAQQGQDTNDYLANAFPELNPWERAGAGGTMAGSANEGFDNAKELTRMQLDNQKDIAKMQMQNNIDIAGIQSNTSRANTYDQVYAQNELLSYQQREINERIVNIAANSQLSEAQRDQAFQSIVESRARTLGINMTTKQTQAAISQINAQTRYISGAQTNQANAAAAASSANAQYISGAQTTESGSRTAQNRAQTQYISGPQTQSTNQNTRNANESQSQAGKIASDVSRLGERFIDGVIEKATNVTAPIRKLAKDYKDSGGVTGVMSQ